MSKKIEFPTAQEIEDDQYSTAQVAAMYDEILAIKGKATCINMSRDSLRAELDKLREAAQDVVESDADARRQQVTHWKNPTIDALAALLKADDE